LTPPRYILVVMGVLGLLRRWFGLPVYRVLLLLLLVLLLLLGSILVL
jgi:hypothetical protein